jgi:hypothetical protein
MACYRDSFIFFVLCKSSYLGDVITLTQHHVTRAEQIRSIYIWQYFQDHLWCHPCPFIHTLLQHLLHNGRLRASQKSFLADQVVGTHATRIIYCTLSYSWLTDQHSKHIAASLQYHASKSLNIYCEVTLCAMCLLAVIPSPCYCLLVALLLVSSCCIRVTHWNKFSCTIPMQEVRKSFNINFRLLWFQMKHYSCICKYIYTQDEKKISRLKALRAYYREFVRNWWWAWTFFSEIPWMSCRGD